MPRRGPGQPPWQPTPKERETVKLMTGYGIPQDAICKVLRVTRPTLEKHCRGELDTGAADANAAMAASMFRMGTRGPYSVRFHAAKFWLAARAGWREADKMVLVPMAAYEMTDDELQTVISRQETYEKERERAAANGQTVVLFPSQPARRRGR